MNHAQPNELTTPQSGMRLLLEAFGKVNLALGGGVSIIASVVVAALAPGHSQIPYWALALAVLLIGWVLGVFGLAFKRAVDQANIIRAEAARITPRINVKSVVTPFEPYQQSKCVLIVEWAPAPPALTTVTVAIAEPSHEVPLGFGTVRGMQADGASVVTLDGAYKDAPEYIKKLLDTSTGKEFATRVRIGTQMSLQYLDASRLLALATSQPSEPQGLPDERKG